jgi:hypothetical protein
MPSIYRCERRYRRRGFVRSWGGYIVLYMGVSVCVVDLSDRANLFPFGRFHIGLISVDLIWWGYGYTVRV